MRNRLIKFLAIIVVVFSLPLLPIEMLFGYPGNLFTRVRQNFEVVMFVVRLG